MIEQGGATKWPASAWLAVAALSAVVVVALLRSGGDPQPPPEPAAATTGQTSTVPIATTPPPSTTAERPELPEPPDAPATELVDRLVVAAPDPGLAPYRRAAFGEAWDYDPASGCNTRERVLIAESLVPATVDDRCRPTGRWRSAYDGVTTSDPADLQIDHLVALADAWRSGAATWTDERRLA
ncbi:MAG TPA: hypothetical protein VHK88_05280, partial [Aquihabitans sp.]|nr:hypothetical protein [Aquihabitans sp.]